MVKVAYCIHGLIGTTEVEKSWKRIGGELDVLTKTFPSLHQYLFETSEDILFF